MSIFGDIGNAFSSAVNTVVHTAEGVASGVAHLAEGAVGEVAKVGESLIGGIIKNPLELLNPFSVLTGAASTLIGDVTGGSGSVASGLKATVGKSLDPSRLFATIGTVSQSAVSGSTIYDKIFDALAKLEGQLNDKADQLNQPGLSDKDSKKLLFDIQQLQDSITQLTTEASNLLKTDHDTEMNLIRNLA